MTRVGIIGIGNILMQDDGVGIFLLHRLKYHAELSDVSFVELGTGGMKLLHYLVEFDKAVIIDSGNFGANPGDFRIFSPHEVQNVKFMSGQSLHEFDLLNTIELSKRMGECPRTLLIFAIQPEHIDFGENLSISLQKRLQEYEEVLVETIHGLMV